MSENFISAYLRHTSIYESPGSFWKWSAYSIISTIVRDRCFIKIGDSPLFPNLYIMLLAESGGHRKNRPVELAEKLIRVCIPNYKVISGRASVQAITDELARTETDNKTGKVIKSSSATFYATELSAALVSDPDGLKILTDIYDFKSSYDILLRTRDKVTVENLVFSMFSASNASMLNGLFDETIIRGGFLARTLLIVPNEFRDSNSLMRVDHEALKLSKELVVGHIKKLVPLNGEFKFEEAAINEYEAWYNPFRQDYLKKKEVSGIVARIHTHVLKIAMILAANDISQCILKRHIEQAIEECLGLIPNYTLFTMSHAKTEVGQAGSIVITELSTAENNMLSRKALIRTHWQSFDIELLDRVVLALSEAGMLQIHQFKDGIHYQLTPQCIAMLK